VKIVLDISLFIALVELQELKKLIVILNLLNKFLKNRLNVLLIPVFYFYF